MVVFEGNAEWYKGLRTQASDGGSRGDSNSARLHQVSQDNQFSGHASCDCSDHDDDSDDGDRYSGAGPASRRSRVQ